jgi:lipoprotein-releasing system permease protein
VYKLLLCWRYLRTRYLALVCIVSVLLGVATLIVVNSVMTGFSTKLRERLHGALSDVVIESDDMFGFKKPEQLMAVIREDPYLGDRIEAMTPTLEVFALVQFNWDQRPWVRVVHLIGVDPAGRAKLGGFAEHLELHKGDAAAAFELDENGQANYYSRHLDLEGPPVEVRPDGRVIDAPPSEKPHLPARVVLGYAIAHYRDRTPAPGGGPQDRRVLSPGDDVIVTTVSGDSAGEMRPVHYRYVLSDYYHSEMSEYDSQYVYVPLKQLQELRNMGDRVTSIQVRLKDYDRDAKGVVERLKLHCAGKGLIVQTWEEKQGPLLGAISIERGILNVILFMIVAVAGFGILAIFSMIVAEKTRDIGVLKALGASNRGVMSIFLGYGLLLGLIGAGLGTALGAAITYYINDIEKFITLLTGHELFDRNIYYFKEIPTDMQPWSVLVINVGAVAIAVVFSILPALRAAWLHPVRALRYE